MLLLWAASEPPRPHRPDGRKSDLWYFGAFLFWLVVGFMIGFAAARWVFHV